MNESPTRYAWCVSRLLALVLCLVVEPPTALEPAGGLAWGGEAPAGEGQAARVAALCKELGQGQFGSQSACEQLIAIGPPAVPALIEALKDPRPPARWWAVAALSNLAADDAYPAVLKVLESDPDPLVRSTAVYYLRHYKNKGKKDIWPVVAKALGDKEPEVGRWALRLMVEDEYPELDKVLRDVLARGPTELRSYALSHIRDLGDKGKTYLPLVRKLLAAEDPRLRYDVVFTVVSLMDSGQMEFLRETLRKDPDPAVKECALRCITVIPEPPVDCFELYIEGMRSENEKVRDVAFKLLTKGFKHYIGFDAKGPLPMREAAIANWREWFAQNRAKLEWHPDLRKFLLQGTRPKPPDKAKGGGKGREND